MTKVSQMIKDGFKNILKGLGGEKDPRTYNDFTTGKWIHYKLANDLYTYNWLCAKAVDIPLDDATRKWISLQIPDADEKKETEEDIKVFDIKESINTAFKWSRVFGGAVILAILENEDLEEPLNVETIKEGSLRNFIILDRYNITPCVINRDVLSDNFGNPEFYQVVRGGQKVHYTRLYKLIQGTPTLYELEKENFWGKSIFTKLWEPISDAQVVTQAISDLVYETNIDVYRLEGLNDLVAEGDDAIVTNRLKIAHKMKSIINGIALDKNDEYDKKSNNFSKLPEIDDRFMQKVSGASDIPLTRLLGISPSGLNATGESDLLNYYDNVQSAQTNELKPAIDWMFSIVTGSLGIEDIEYVFNPLRQLTEAEQADVDSKNATRDETYLNNNIIQRSDILAELSENGTYVTINAKRVEEEKALEELEFEEEEYESGEEEEDESEETEPTTGEEE